MKCSAIVLAAAALLVTVAEGSQDRRTQEGARQRGPESFPCDRNNLTSDAGVVRHSRRDTGATSLTIRTDYDTTEDVSLAHPGTDDRRGSSA